jgi:hypothetical protein
MTFVKVGGQTLASQAAARRKPDYVPPYGGGPWTPAPSVIPAGAYNPIQDIEVRAGQRTLENTLADLATKNSRAESDLTLSEGDIQRQEKEQGEDHAHALATLALNYQRLGGRQTEAARAAGVSRGGALLQAAAKRAANQKRDTEPIDQAYQRALEGDHRALARLVLARQRESEDSATAGSRAEREQGQYALDTRAVEAREATANGYIDPGGVVPHTSIQPGAGFVRVGYPARRRR